ncbi:hypothetical protein HDA32_002409 [Spinactinospora alkalitolerans]|uniref:Glycosyltransferase n=1 Tax=Spinactinospora alkalitolerans TaxID=687207 RepID=A0A852TTE8_9ACTN|nr:glycosyltransferase family 2 protein [Spinactinospora alkalitolerans]NYE47289.1 hypothetical protein [Spinactinospora alkalitolerans]
MTARAADAVPRVHPPAPPRGTGAVGYVLPLRWDDDSGLAELTAYLHRIGECAEVAEVVVVDGSPPALFRAHARAWGGAVRHLRPDERTRCGNGKVSGVLTGVRHATAERLIIADDDVRYDGPALRAVASLLDRADLVRPQNFFEPAPWHALWDTARTLINRSVGRDYPGTFGIRRSTFLAMGGYDGGVLFENLELIRTVRAHGGTEARPLDVYVRRLPPGTGRFWAQRLRQAYDDTAQPARMALFLSVLPAVAAAVRGRRFGLLLAGAALPVALAEVGRRRAGGSAVFPAASVLLAPIWVLERGVCVWPALVARLRGTGVAYAGAHLRLAAHSTRHLRARARRTAASASPAARG